MFLLGFTSILVLFVAAKAGAATTLCVNPGGTDGCFATIQEAVDAASRDTRIDIAAGTYTENVDIPQKARLSLHGAGAHVTHVEGAGGLQEVVISIVDRARVSLEGLTIRDGDVGLELQGARVTVRDCVFDDNGLGIGTTLSRLTLERSAIRDGTVLGIAAVSRSKIEVRNGTLHPNAQGILIADGTRTTLKDSTVSGNGPDGGILAGSNSRLTIVGSAGPKTRVVSWDYNLFEGNCVDVEGKTENTLFAVDAMLEPLADNGGPTLTHALLPGSPAIGAGNPKQRPSLKFCSATDQRGVPRSGRCDIGAFELEGGL